MALRSSEAAAILRPIFRPILCAVLDAQSLGREPGRAARELFDAGGDWIELRDRKLEGDALFSVARALVSARDTIAPRTSDPMQVGSRTRCVLINRRIDIAGAARADGVHLGFDALDAVTAARLLADQSWIGTSLHSIAEVAAIAKSTHDIPGRYAHLAPIWDPLSKPASRPALGWARLAEACAGGARILAQGGIEETNAAEALRAGAVGVAVTGILANAHTRIERTRGIRAALDGQRSPRG